MEESGFLTHLFPRKKMTCQKYMPIIDNAGSYPNEEELKCGEIQVLFLTPNVISLLELTD